MATSALPSSGGDVSAIPAALAISENFYAALFLPVTIYRIHTSGLRFAAKLDSISAGKAEGGLN
ncbi:hypothetical protein NKG60_28145, partial [Mesorhizobium sp. M1428]|uniref:hypothetical protein n=1 Tax=unclassified Mesorhizobium TaxID=325217 RepID=UPI00333C3B51